MEVEEKTISERNTTKFSGPKPWINCVRPGNNSCAHPSSCSRTNKCHYS